MVYLFLAEGFEEVEALCPLDILRRGGVEVKTVGVTGKWVTGAHKITVEADILPDAVEKGAEMLIFPGGMPGSINLDQSKEVDAILAREKDSAHLAAICAAPLVLGRRGLLQGKHAVCYPGFEDELKGYLKAEGKVVTDGNVTTAMGMGVAPAFGFALLTLLKGEEVCKAVSTSAMF